MTDRELMQQALDALDSALSDNRPYIAACMEAHEALRARLAQPEPEPVAWVAYENGEKHGIDFDEDEIAELPVGTMLYPIPLHFLDPAKVARLIDEAFERGKKEIDMEQVKDIAQKLADCALLNSAPPQRDEAPAKAVEWQGLTDEEVEEILYNIRGKTMGVVSTEFLTRAIEAKLKEKNIG